MSSVKGKLVRLLGGFVLRGARVTAADSVGEGFRRIALQGAELRAQPGDKIQVLLPSDDVRTYTPIPSADGATLLGWRHASAGPGARWITEARAGDDIRFVGAQSSLSFPPGPLILVGDETSVAVAASFAAARSDLVQTLFEAQSPKDLRRAAQAVGLEPFQIVARADMAALVEAVVRARANAPAAAIGLTGGSVLVQALHAALRDRGIAPTRRKAYWVPGRTGLD